MQKSFYLVDENWQGRNGCLNTIGTVAFVVAMFVIAALVLSSCSTTKCLPEKVEVHDTIVRIDSVYKERVRDSIVYKDRQDSTYIYEKDSVSEKQKGDTIYVTKWRVKYHYIYKGQSDKVQSTNETTQSSTSQDKEKKQEKEVVVKETRYIPKFYKVVTWTAIVWLLIRLVWCVLGWIPQTSPWRNMVQKVIDRIVKFIRLR